MEKANMGKVNDYSVQLIEDWGDSVDIYYTQFLVYLSKNSAFNS